MQAPAGQPDEVARRLELEKRNCDIAEAALAERRVWQGVVWRYSSAGVHVSSGGSDSAPSGFVPIRHLSPANWQRVMLEEARLKAAAREGRQPADDRERAALRRRAMSVLHRETLAVAVSLACAHAYYSDRGGPWTACTCHLASRQVRHASKPIAPWPRRCCMCTASRRGHRWLSASAQP